MAALMKKKVTPKDMNPKRILGQGDEVRRLMLGRLIGVASGITKVTSPEGEELKGLTGSFKFNDAIETGLEIRSGVLWFPSGMGTQIVSAIEDDGVAAVRFAFDMVVMRAENPAGYEWAMTPLIEPTEDNPLAALESEIKASAPLITDESGKGEGAAVEKPKAKANA